METVQRELAGLAEELRQEAAESGADPPSPPPAKVSHARPRVRVCDMHLNSNYTTAGGTEAVVPRAADAAALATPLARPEADRRGRDQAAGKAERLATART